MSQDNDDAEKLRIDDADTAQTSRPDTQDETEGNVAGIGVTVSGGSYPTTAGVMYMVQRQTVLGTETEGSVGTTTNVGSPIAMKHVGTTAPPVASPVIWTLIDYRYVFEW